MVNRCFLYKVGDNCCIDRSRLRGVPAYRLRHDYPDLFHSLRAMEPSREFSASDVMVCSKHLNQYYERSKLVPLPVPIYTDDAIEQRNVQPKRLFSSERSLSQSLDASSPSKNSGNLHDRKCSDHANSKELDETVHITIYYASHYQEYRMVSVNKHNETISDLKQRILKLWPSCNATEEQIEIYVRDNTSNVFQSLRNVSKKAHLCSILKESPLTVEFIITSKVDLPVKTEETIKPEQTLKNVEKKQETAEKSSSNDVVDHSKAKLGKLFDQKQIPKGLCGLENMGNTCYMNSALQCLSNILPLKRFFSDKPILNFVNSKNPAGFGGRIALTYSTLVQEMWSGNIETCTPSSLKNVIDRCTTQFTEHNQHDSQELMNFLLDALHEDLLDNHSQSSPIAKLFQGRLSTHVHCEHACPEVLTPSTFTFLPLPLPLTKGKVNLHDCLKEFLEPEAIGNHGKWLCNTCQQKTNACKSTRITSLPPVLILQLKRFRTVADRPSKSRKIEAFVDYPLKDLNLSDLLSTASPYFTYDLASVSVHHGALEAGHYTTFAKNYNNDLWYHFDDSIVTSANEEDVRTKNAYILCYVRKGSN